MLLGARKPMVEVDGRGVQVSAAVRKAHFTGITNPKVLASHESVATATVPAGAAAWFRAAAVAIALVASSGR